jgi:thiol-disulfide isomerase/thioredoxin
VSRDFHRFLVILATTAALAGCGSPGGSGAAPEKSGGKGATAAATNEPTLPELKGEVKLEAASWEDVEKKIESYKGKKIVVLDFWSNWCDPCLRELPGLVKLQRQYMDDVVCITLNLNYSGIEPEPTDEHKAPALEFLQKKDAKIVNYLSTVADEKLYELAKIGSVPTVIVYGKDGEVAKKFEDSKEYGAKGFSYEKHIEPFVKTLVSGPKS